MEIGAFFSSGSLFLARCVLMILPSTLPAPTPHCPLIVVNSCFVDGHFCLLVGLYLYRIFRPLRNMNGPDFLFLRHVFFFILRSSGVRIAKMKSVWDDAGSLRGRPALPLLVVLLRDCHSTYYHCLCLCLFVYLSLVWFGSGSLKVRNKI
jgi:hypothetical protein